jgi:hypothetical protein
VSHWWALLAVSGVFLALYLVLFGGGLHSHLEVYDDPPNFPQSSLCPPSPDPVSGWAFEPMTAAGLNPARARYPRR